MEIKNEFMLQFSLCLILLLCLGETSHRKCEKFQLFLLKEFGRLFRLYNDLGKKETATSERLLRALEKCDDLEVEVQKLRDELSEYHFYEYDL